MECLRNFSSCTHFSNTASVPEVFIPVVTALVWVIWGLMLWWYRRKGESAFVENASRVKILLAWMGPVLCGFAAVLLAVFAFLPHDLL